MAADFTFAAQVSHGEASVRKVETLISGSYYTRVVAVVVVNSRRHTNAVVVVVVASVVVSW